MNKITFTGDYKKLHGQRKATLLSVDDFNYNKDTDANFIKYDTEKTDGSFYPLRKGKYLKLTFVGNKSIEFTTLRPAYPPSKKIYYESKVSETFEINIKE